MLSISQEEAGKIPHTIKTMVENQQLPISQIVHSWMHTIDSLPKYFLPIEKQQDVPTITEEDLRNKTKKELQEKVEEINAIEKYNKYRAQDKQEQDAVLFHILLVDPEFYKTVEEITQEVTKSHEVYNHLERYANKLETIISKDNTASNTASNNHSIRSIKFQLKEDAKQLQKITQKIRKSLPEIRHKNTKLFSEIEG